MLKFFYVFMFITLLSGNLYANEQIDNAEIIVERPNTAVVLVYTADWCTICKVLIPKLNDVRAIMDDEKVEFIEIDYSNDKTELESYRKLVKKGLGDYFYFENKKQAGFARVFDINLNEMDMLTVDNTKKRMVYYIRKAISASAIKYLGNVNDL